MDACSAELRQRLVAALAALTRAVEGESFPDAVINRLARILTYTMTGASGFSILHDELGRKLRESPEFKSLHEYVMGDAAIRDAFFEAKEKPSPAQLRVFSLYIEATLARILLLIRYRERSEPEIQLVDQFVSFLSPGHVRRKVSLPINHLAINEPELDLGTCGKLFSTQAAFDTDHPYSEVVKVARLPNCKLVFEIETGKFESVKLTGVSEPLRQRIALIRLVVQPLASFNHFSVSHIEPWEEPLDDTAFFERFWAGSSGGTKEIGQAYMSQEDARQVSVLSDACDEFDWRSGSPWRLAVNRLDDAVYKLECGSTDSLLDVVIGLESVMVEADSTQESTHKVASRTARFLNDDIEGRQTTFKRVKQLYGFRSKIAHGKTIPQDKSQMTALADGAAILCRVLKKMLERRQVQLDHQLLDLG